MNQERAEELYQSTYLTWKCCTATVRSSEILTLAGVQDVDTFIAATGENETNIMSSLLAKNMILQKRGGQNGGTEKTIALVDKEDYLVLAATIGLDIALNRKIMAANAILETYPKKRADLSCPHARI